MHYFRNSVNRATLVGPFLAAGFLTSIIEIEVNML